MLTGEEKITVSDISAAQVKELRDRTGVGMMDCKKALAETDGNMDEAIQWLRSKGLAAAAKKAAAPSGEESPIVVGERADKSDVISRLTEINKK